MISCSGKAPTKTLVPSGQFKSQKENAPGRLEEVAVSIPQGIKADSIAAEKARLTNKSSSRAFL